MFEEDHYEVLGVRPEAPLWEIELAYKGRRSQYHPDRYAAGDEVAVAWATAKMQAVNKAYAVLKDPDQRDHFDRTQASAKPADPGPRTERAKAAEPPPLRSLREALEALEFIRAANPAALPQVADMLPKAGPPPGVQTITLEAAAEKYLTYLAGKDLPPNQQKTRGARVRAVRHFLNYVRPGTTRVKASAPRAKLYDIGWFECAGFHVVKSRAIKENTAGNYMLWLSGFFEWAQVSGYYPQGDNPAKGFGGQSKKNKRESRARGGPFAQEQLRTIFSPANFERMPLAHTRWLVLLALYTGARSNELAYLER